MERPGCVPQVLSREVVGPRRHVEEPVRPQGVGVGEAIQLREGDGSVRKGSPRLTIPDHSQDRSGSGLNEEGQLQGDGEQIRMSGLKVPVRRGAGFPPWTTI